MANAVKVGLFTLVGLAIVAFLILRTEDFNPFAPEGRRLEAVFTSVAGLDDKAPVRIAGVRVGRVDGIGLAGQEALVHILLESDVELPEGTTAAIRNMGLLGDRYVELVLGPPGAPPLPEGTRLAGTTPPSFDDAMAKLNDVAESIQQMTGEIAGPEGQSRIGPMLDNIGGLAADLRALVAANRDSVTNSARNFEVMSAALARDLPRLASQIERVLSQVEAVVAENRGAFSGSLENVQELTAKLQTSADNLNAISGKIARGEGTIGKLVNDETAHDQLVSTLETVKGGVTSLSDTLGRINKYRLDLGIEGGYLEGPQESRTALSLQLDPGTDRFYRAELVDDPRGRTRSRTEVVTVTRPDGSTETTTTDRVTTEDDLRISAQFGFRFGDAQFRAGLFESTGGAAVDYNLFDRRLQVSLEAFEFGREGDLDPRLRLLGRYRFHPNLFVVGGYDDFLVSDQESFYLGAGITWRDDDLKYLLGSLPLGGL